MNYNKKSAVFIVLLTSLNQCLILNVVYQGKFASNRYF